MNSLIEKLKENALQEKDGAKGIAQILGQMHLAKKFPRNMVEVEKELLSLCQNRDFSETAFFSIPRGGRDIEGPSIRLAEAAATAMGNLNFGIDTSLEDDQSTRFTAYALDLEKNTSVVRSFIRKHEKKIGKKIVKINDPSQIYEVIAADATKRLRACLFAIIPRYLIDKAEEACRLTLKRSEPTKQETIQRILMAFEEYNVSKNDIETKIGKQLEEVTADDVVLLRGSLNAIKQGIASKDDIFKKEDSQ